ncbi:MAG TPA: TIM-barrel domain-containing protein [Anaerolineae bacterium]
MNLSATIPAHFQVPQNPVAHPDQIVRGPSVRFTVLTSRLIRMEYSANESFEDRASQVFWQRAQPVPEFRVTRSDTHIEIDTEHLHLRYTINAKGFTPQSLRVTVQESGTKWRYGMRDRDNLRGTARTLDQADGAVRLSEGLMSRSGWAVVDDSNSLVFNADGWLAPRQSHNLDLYFFGYGHDYGGCLRDFARVAGEMPLVPRFALGNWWSRYWEYTQAELTQVVKDFRAHEIPLAVCIVDMDWHITQTGNDSSGWTGYTWNRALFPDPKSFIAWLHEQGLKTALNLHPAEGVHPHEEQYDSIAQRMGIEAETREPVAFDIADPEFVRAYFEILHHPYEKDGVDFWWIDWQQGTQTKLAGLDPLYALNHLHFYDHARRGDKRPFIFSRWAGLGGYRYAIGFSGDTYITWASLAFQPYFTATAANVAFGWWSHDIGGHQGGIEDTELYTRWVQYGVFSPILRLHSTNNPYHDRRPFAHDAETLQLTRKALQLRHALIPYIYSAAWQYHRSARPLCLPMYYEHPQAEAAYQAPNQYYFGSDLLAAPFVSPRDPDTRLAKQTVWLPSGDWFNFFTGEFVRGGGWKSFYGGLDEIPVFARAGAIVPLAPKTAWGGIENPRELIVHIFAGADHAYELFEDDGESLEFTHGKFCTTQFTQKWSAGELAFTIHAASGDRSPVPAKRVYTLVIHGIGADFALRTAKVESEYDAHAESLTLRGIVLKPTDEFMLALRARLSKRDRRAETIRKMLRAFRLDTNVKRRIDDEIENLFPGRTPLRQFGNQLSDAQMNALASVIQG